MEARDHVMQVEPEGTPEPPLPPFDMKHGMFGDEIAMSRYEKMNVAGNLRDVCARVSLALRRLGSGCPRSLVSALESVLLSEQARMSHCPQ